jgi:hybrid cluster-associated redox disulfide protein
MELTITKDMVIAKVISLAPETIDVFMEFGMHCVGCMAAAGETIEEAAAVHGIDVDELVDALNAEIA